MRGPIQEARGQFLLQTPYHPLTNSFIVIIIKPAFPQDFSLLARALTGKVQHQSQTLRTISKVKSITQQAVSCIAQDALALGQSEPSTISGLTPL